MRSTFLLLLVAAWAYAGSGTWTFQGPCGGRILDLAFDDAHPGVVYALGYGHGYRSTDGGLKWASLDLPFEATHVRVQDGNVFVAEGISGALHLAFLYRKILQP